MIRYIYNTICKTRGNDLILSDEMQYKVQRLYRATPSHHFDEDTSRFPCIDIQDLVDGFSLIILVFLKLQIFYLPTS